MTGVTTREGLELVHGDLTREIIGAPTHEIQLVNYLKASKIPAGIILNFGPEPTFRRLLLTSNPKGSAVIRSIV